MQKHSRSCFRPSVSQKLIVPKKLEEKIAEYDNDPDTELQYVGGLSGPIGSPKPKNTPAQTNYIGGLRGTVGNPIPKHETPGPSGRQSYLFKLGQAGGKYGFFPFMPAEETQGRWDKIVYLLDEISWSYTLLLFSAVSYQTRRPHITRNKQRPSQICLLHGHTQE